jgi:hypothetical protein
VKSLRDPLKWIGCYQIGGALLATEVLQRQLSTFVTGGPIGWLFLAVITGFFTLSGVAGVFLLRGAPLGKTLTVIAQVPQVLWVDMPGLLYYATCGASFALNWRKDWLGFTPGIGSQFSLFVRHVPGDSSRFAVNFVPLVVLYVLYRRKT